MALIAGDQPRTNDPAAWSVISAFGSAASGASGSSSEASVPMWRTRPNPRRVSKRGPHTVAENASQITPEDFATPDFAASAWFDMSQQERDQFALYAQRYGMVRPEDANDPGALMNAWQQMVQAASQYNKGRDVGQWISPWEAIHRFAGQRLAGSDGSVDLYKAQTNRTVNKRKFTKEEIAPTLDELFQREMGRTPTKRELNIYLRAIQAAYDRHPETQVQHVQPGPNGTNVTNTISGGVDVPGELASRVRDTGESDAYQAGVTYMQALEQAIRSPI